MEPRGEGEPPRTSFEIAILWLELCREQLWHREGKKYETTQMGLNIYPSGMDGFMRECMFLNGIYDWTEKRRPAAKKWFLRAKEHAVVMETKDYPEGEYSPILGDMILFYGGLPALVDLEEKADGGDPVHERAYLEALQGLVTTGDR